MRWELVGQWPAPHGGAWRSVARRQARTATAGHVAANACRSIPSAGSGGRLLGARCERRRRNVRPSGTSGRRCTHGAPRAGTATSSPPTCPASPSRLPRWSEEVRLWGEHGEAFDEADVIEKSKQGIVVAIFVGLTAGSFKGVTQASSSSATQIFIDLDIPDITNFRESYKWEAPPLQQHVPQVLQLSPIQAAGQIYKLNQITELPTSSFQGGATYSCIAKISAIVPSTNWYYKVCRSCKVGYDSISEDPRCDCPAPKPMPMYKLPITITDDTGSINTIAFSFIAEDLVERSAYHASQNMKIGATEPAVAFEKAIGKTRLFHIGMGTNSSSSFAIKYVIRKSFPIDNPSSPLKATPIMPALPSPPQNTGSESSKAKRSLEFKEDTKCSEEQQQTTSDTLPKRQKPKLADDNTTEDTTKSSQNNLPNNKI